MTTLQYFKTTPFLFALKQFFQDDLHLPLHFLADEPTTLNQILGFESQHDKDVSEVYALGMVDDAAFDTGKSTFDDVAAVKELNKDYDGILLFGVTLKLRENDLLPTRGKLADITRAFNRAFKFTPVVVVFRYNDHIAFANCERSQYQQSWREGEKAGKVSLLRDIDINNTHAGHQRILQGLQVPKTVKNFNDLYQYWQKALDVSILNKDFYRELSNWFFAARKDAKFPDTSENATERGLIRLITRLIFTWFVKERGLVPEDLFDQTKISVLLKDAQPESDTYYRAVLQNLFFATLNSEMGERRFRKEQGGVHGQKDDYGISQYFRYESTFTDSKQWLDLVKDVPFLNGGLFECLDPEDKDGPRIDGFSDVESRQAHLPNKLFWGETFSADLSDVYNNKKQKSVEVTPLLNLLHGYKFTITENTPLEQDVALDPELLGKVFENLLASYNPETRTTARKQTGSFYTPREIVNYMVEEALYAYLVGAGSSRPDDSHLVEDEGGKTPPLRELLNDADGRNAAELGFSEKEIQSLVNAINHCTILDPACGSGAFPMGALSKMVMLLGKLDPDNEIWLTSQLAAVDKALEATGADKSTIAEAKKSVREAFSHNDPDYARKLYLIERCLFGVDIQPIALQITKLRFFIALIIDQKIDDAKPNRNIRALPNLETKFVAANSLISLPEIGAITPRELPALEEELAAIRYKHIAPKSRIEKKRLEKEDKRVRGEIQTLMLEAGFGDSFVTPLVNWNPYDQNAVAPFFDRERMFGPEMKGGFDIVMGNPPYVSFGLRGGLKMTPSDKSLLREQFKNSAEYKISVYALFMEFAIRHSKTDGGVQTFITPDSFLLGMYFSKIRKFILERTKIRSLILLPYNVFQAVVGISTIFVFQCEKVKTLNWNVEIGKVLSPGELESNTFQSFEISQSYYDSLHLKRFRMLFTTAEADYVIRLEDTYPTLKSLAKVTTGVRSKVGKDAVISIQPQGTTWKKGIISGSQVTPYQVKWNGYWINIDGELLFSGGWNPDYVEKEKLIIRQTGDSIIAGIDFDSLYHLNNCHTCSILSKDIDLFYLSCVLNSKVLNTFYQLISLEKNRPMAQLDIETLNELPIPTATPAQQKVLSTKVDKILTAKAADPNADTSALEREIDILVADLYGLNEEERTLIGL